MFKRNEVFETVLKANHDYINAVNSGEGKEVQENLLKQCAILIETMVFNAGLATEYKDYCDYKHAVYGNVFA